MNDENLGKPQGVIAAMLRTLDGEQTGNDPPVILEMEAESVPSDSAGGDEVLELHREFNYDGYQVVRREFFAHINEPSVTFNNYKFYVNAACLNRFPQVDQVQVLVNQESKILAIRPCRAEDRDACAWCTTGSGRRKPKQITCKIFFAKVFSLMGWNLDYRYIPHDFVPPQ